MQIPLLDPGLALRVSEGLGVVWGLGFGGPGSLGCKRPWGLGFRVWGLGFGVSAAWSLGCRI